MLASELNKRQSFGVIDKDAILLCTEDPKVGVGSGGATLNALLLVTEYLSAQQGYNVSSEYKVNIWNNE